AVGATVRKEVEKKPALLFDHIKGYPPGYRVLVGPLNSARRMALTTNLPLDTTAVGLVQEWRKKDKAMAPIPPMKVDRGPVLENVHMGDEVNLYEFPAPFWHELDGGRYLGTNHAVITRDPDEGWVNLGTYRTVVHDEKTLGFYMSPGRHADFNRQKYWDRGEPCPIAISLGHDPLLFFVACQRVAYGLSEYDYAGGLKGQPIEVIEGKLTGLPIPAQAEIVLEGECVPGENRLEGPFGEWTGYYGKPEGPAPVIRVKAVYHRNDPILCGGPASTSASFFSIARSAMVWDQVEAAGVPDVKGVWCEPNLAHGHPWLVISIKQRYPGHAKQAALIASQCDTAAYAGRFIIVVDDDIDPSNIMDVLWAMCTRSDPERSIDIIRRCWSGPLDTALPPGKRGFNSRAIIDACRPYEWMKDFPAVVGVSAPLRDRVIGKWGEIMFGREP
ncbi:MAG: UbiD family decarboxylase, partial [Dehalococcoidia bacterium]|nr:UbiD family decarboxylase [Dehalococcoidia bacterium]